MPDAISLAEAIRARRWRKIIRHATWVRSLVYSLRTNPAPAVESTIELEEKSLFPHKVPIIPLVVVYPRRQSREHPASYKWEPGALFPDSWAAVLGVGPLGGVPPKKRPQDVSGFEFVPNAQADRLVYQYAGLVNKSKANAPQTLLTRRRGELYECRTGALRPNRKPSSGSKLASAVETTTPSTTTYVT